MKKFIVILIFSTILLSGCIAQRKEITAVKINDIEERILETLDNEFGYCDVSKFYQENYFSSIKDLCGCKIYASNESTNFDEFGIFEFANEKAAKAAKKEIIKYLENAKRDFTSGIVYNISEYPKFEAARVERVDNFLIYGILDKSTLDELFDELGYLVI